MSGSDQDDGGRRAVLPIIFTKKTMTMMGSDQADGTKKGPPTYQQSLVLPQRCLAHFVKFAKNRSN